MNRLQPLRDLAHIEGSFVMDARANIVASDLAHLFKPDMQLDAAMRIRNVLHLMDGHFDAVEEVSARFERFLMLVKRAPHHVLVVFATQRPTASTLRMSMALVLRDFENDVVRAVPRSSATPLPQLNFSPSAPSAPQARPLKAPTSAPRPGASAAKPKKKNGIWGD